MIYAEVLQVADTQTARLPPKPTMNTMLRHSRSEENIIEGVVHPSIKSYGTPPSTENGSDSNLTTSTSPPSSSPSNIPTSNSSCFDSDCWSQEDDEISQQVSTTYFYEYNI